MTRRADSVPFRVAARRWLDAPYAERPVWTWPFLPVLACVSFLVGCVAAVRRALDDLRRAKEAARGQGSASGLGRPAGPLIVCVGNIVMGGAGKSPVAQALLVALLERGCTVALVARGYGSEDGGVRVERADALDAFEPGRAPWGDEPKEAPWGDELKEHVTLLARALGHEALTRCYVVQAASRARGLEAWDERLRRDGLSPAQRASAVAVLDDGLQHFGVRPHVRICVWPEGLYGRAPKAAFPLGPYREGLGLGRWAGVEAFLGRFDVHVWSRVPPHATPDDKHAFVERVRAHVAHASHASFSRSASEGEPSGRPLAFARPAHVVAIARSEWVWPRAVGALEGAGRENAHDAQGASRWAEAKACVAVLDDALVQGRVALLCGVAMPDAFARDARHALARLPVPLSARALDALAHIPLRALPDHGVPTPEDEAWLARFSVVVTSAKDAARVPVGASGTLGAAARDGHLWVLCVKVHFEDTQENPWEPLRLILGARAASEGLLARG